MCAIVCVYLCVCVCVCDGVGVCRVLVCSRERLFIVAINFKDLCVDEAVSHCRHPIAFRSGITTIEGMSMIGKKNVRIPWRVRNWILFNGTIRPEQTFLWFLLEKFQQKIYRTSLTENRSRFEFNFSRFELFITSSNALSINSITYIRQWPRICQMVVAFVGPFE